MSNDNIFVTGESVHHKRVCDRYWRGPAVGLGKDGQEVLVKQGGIYVRCHSRRLAFEHDTRYREKKPKNHILAETEIESITEDDNNIDKLRRTHSRLNTLSANPTKWSNTALKDLITIVAPLIIMKI